MLFSYKYLQRNGQKGDRSTLQKSKRIRAVFRAVAIKMSLLFATQKSKRKERILS